MVSETWKDVIGFEGLYEVSTQGRVRSINRTVKYVRCGKEITCKFDGKILQPLINNNGYTIIRLSRSGVCYTKYVHKLVAESFISKPRGSNCVIHFDGNKNNNSVGNLKWHKSFNTRSEPVKVKQIDPITNEVIAIYDSIGKAGKFISCAPQNIHQCLQGIIKTARGYYWERV